MATRQHFQLLYLGTSLWTFFFLGGLWSDYYQTWPWGVSFLVLTLLPTFVLWVFAPKLLAAHLPAVPPVAGACWIAFYFTVPLAFYDTIYLVLYRRLGAGFVWTHWYLSIFYLIPWVVLPLQGAALARRRARLSGPDTP